MKKSFKNKHFSLNLAVIFRLILFVAIIYLSINYLGGRSDSKIKGVSTAPSNTYLKKYADSLYSSLPDSSKHTLEHFSETKVYQIGKEKSALLKSELNDFPGKQIKDIKKAIINSIANELVKNIDNSK